MNSQGMMRTLATGVQSRMDEATQERVEKAVTATVRTLATEEISKAYAGRQVVRGVSMEIAQEKWWGCWDRTARARRPSST